MPTPAVPATTPPIGLQESVAPPNLWEASELVSGIPEEDLAVPGLSLLKFVMTNPAIAAYLRLRTVIGALMATPSAMVGYRLTRGTFTGTHTGSINFGCAALSTSPHS